MVEQCTMHRPELGKLSPAHRLDKPVSGVLLLTRNAAAAEGVRGKITEREVSKGYVARVEGMCDVYASCMVWDALSCTVEPKYCSTWTYFWVC
jgi:23S rRNA-/tRNA-specific pseudouridylate synthase